MEKFQSEFTSSSDFLCREDKQYPLGMKGQIMAAVCVHACKGQTLISVPSCIQLCLDACIKPSEHVYGSVFHIDNFS